MMHGYNHNTDDKAQLINDNLDIVKKIAFFYVGRVGKVVEVDDLLQLGMVGLIEAAHNCVKCRGIGHQGTAMKTSKLTGEFIESTKTRNEFYDFIRS